jgi:hypothetical protein
MGAVQSSCAHSAPHFVSFFRERALVLRRDDRSASLGRCHFRELRGARRFDATSFAPARTACLLIGWLATTDSPGKVGPLVVGGVVTVGLILLVLIVRRTR